MVDTVRYSRGPAAVVKVRSVPFLSMSSKTMRERTGPEVKSDSFWDED